MATNLWEIPYPGTTNKHTTFCVLLPAPPTSCLLPPAPRPLHRRVAQRINERLSFGRRWRAETAN